MPLEVPFDPAYYRAQLVPGTVADGEDALEHYLEIGWRCGANPHPDFSTDGYLIANPDVDQAGLNPLQHWCDHGRSERRPAPTVAETATSDLGGLVGQEYSARRSALVRYAARAGLLLSHVDIWLRPPGVRGMRRAPRWFDAEFYLGRYADVRRAGLDPYWHYVTEGFREGRLPNARVSTRDLVPRNEVDAVLAARTPVKPASAGAEDAVPDGALVDDTSSLAAAIAPLFGGAAEMVVSFGHDDWAVNVGGIQLCIGFEQRQAAEQGIDFITVFPAAPRNTLAPTDRSAPVRARVNGRLVAGSFPLDTLADALGASSDRRVGEVVVHSVFGFAPEQIVRFIEAVGPAQHTWWVHDYSAQCVNPKLLRNNVHWCASPPLGAQCCELCIHGTQRDDHVRRVHGLLGRFPWDVVAPSEVAATVAGSGGVTLPAPVRVVPHARLVEGNSRAGAVLEGPLTVAFVGLPAVAKGWIEFVQMTEALVDEPFRFVHLGAENCSIEGVRFVETMQGSDDFGLVSRLLVENGVHAVFNWARWNETFNWVTFEAMAAGCLIVTHGSSGNVVEAARAADRAVEFATMSDVLAPGALHRALLRALSSRVPVIGEVEVTGLSLSAAPGGTRSIDAATPVVRS